MTKKNTTARKVKRPNAKQLAARAKFPRLYAWLRAAKRYGTAFYRCDSSRSNWSAKVLLWTIRQDRQSFKPGPWLDCAWPDDAENVAGFSKTFRAFVVHGVGFSRVDHVMESLGHTFGVSVADIRTEQLNRPE